MSESHDIQHTSNTYMDNPLIWPILEVLRNEPVVWKVHTLCARLNELGYIPNLDPSPERDLFKRNFLIMNGLYQLQDALYPEEWLRVESMNIVLSSNELNSNHTQEIVSSNEPLRHYYTDWSNYEASEDEVKRLLNQFWQHYRDYVASGPVLDMNRAQALQQFELPIDANYSDIRKRWRKLALRWHPDRTDGDAERFRVLCEAWNILRN